MATPAMIRKAAASGRKTQPCDDRERFGVRLTAVAAAISPMMPSKAPEWAGFSTCGGVQHAQVDHADTADDRAVNVGRRATDEADPAPAGHAGRQAKPNRHHRPADGDARPRPAAID